MNDLSLDAREVLAHLNNLGYRNISAQQLKEFIKDLKKLIKYERRFGPYQDQESNQNLGKSGRRYYMSPEIQSDHRTQTDKRVFNSRTSSPKFSPTSFILPPLNNRSSNSPKSINKRKSASASISPRDYTNNLNYKNASTSPILSISTRKPISLKNCSPRNRVSRMSSPGPRQNFSECYQRRSRSALGRVNLEQTQILQRSNSACSGRTNTLKQMKVARECNMEKQQTRKSTPIVPHNKPLKADPVQLYQYYKSEWERFKNNTPGESPRSDLRWKIHQKILKGRQ